MVPRLLLFRPPSAISTPETQAKTTTHLYPISYGKGQAQVNGKSPYDLNILCWVWQTSAYFNGCLSSSRSLRQLHALELTVTDPARVRPDDISQRFCAIYKSVFTKHFLMNNNFIQLQILVFAVIRGNSLINHILF